MGPFVSEELATAGDFNSFTATLAGQLFVSITCSQSEAIRHACLQELGLKLIAEELDGPDKET